MKSLLLGMVIVAAFGAVAMPSAAHAQQARTGVTRTIGTVELTPDSAYQEITKVDANGKVATHRFELLLPDGASLQSLPTEKGQHLLLDEILVTNEKGEVIGQFDAAWAQDANGNSLPTSFTIEGRALVQTIDTANAEEHSATAVLMYNGRNVQGGNVASTGAGNEKSYVGIPAGYVYDLHKSPKWLHDYCTASPDEFPNPVGGNANFRGPCARHDICYWQHVSWSPAGQAAKIVCDHNLHVDLFANCDDKYSWLNPVRSLCHRTADIYWLAVTAAGNF